MHKHKSYARWPLEQPIIHVDNSNDPGSPSPLESPSDEGPEDAQIQPIILDYPAPEGAFTWAAGPDEPPPLADTSTENTDDEGADDSTSAPPTVYDTGANTHVVTSMGAFSGTVAEGNCSTGGSERAALEVASTAAYRAGGMVVTTDNACLGFNAVTRPARARHVAPIYHTRPQPQFRALLSARLLKAVYDPKAGPKGD
jgi:hypothetical protein